MFKPTTNSLFLWYKGNYFRKKNAGKQTLLPQSLQKQSHCNNDIHFLWKK